MHRVTIFGAAILLCTNAVASGVDYSNVCGISRDGERQGLQAINLKVRFKSGEELCSKDDGCVAARYVATVLEGPPEDMGRDVSIITSANVVLGKRYLIFARKVDVSDAVARFPSELFYRKVDIRVPKDIDYFTSPENTFRLYGNQYYRMVPARDSLCNESPDCDWINAHNVLDSKHPVANIEVRYPNLEDELAICKAEPSKKPYEVYRELSEKASIDASKDISSDHQP